MFEDVCPMCGGTVEESFGVVDCRDPLCGFSVDEETYKEMYEEGDDW
jgi:hypothetical protein